MNFWKKASGILGMNARNLSYIARYNSRANKKFADDKIFTKNFLSSRGIGVAKLFHVITNYRQLTHEFFVALPESFVIKPNRGYGGGGILVIVAKKENIWITASGRKLDKEFLYKRCIEILEGKYSISGVSDTVIFEERLDPHPAFRTLTESGLPDIRVIIFNLVPVLAMVRIPTIESEGKANMELGAIAMGIDIGTGRTTGAALFSKFIKKMPNGEPVIGFQIPFWDEILETVSKIQNTTKIGFLGCDLVVTKTGVKILEMNARSGLKIQIANREPLKTRLEKVADLKVLTPSEGVEIAKTLFSQNFSSDSDAPSKPIIGIFEQVILNAEKPQNCIAKIDLAASENKISAKLFDSKNKILDITIAGKRLKLPVEKGKTIDADLILAGKFLTDFFIDPNKKTNKNIEILTANVDEKMIQNIDEKMADIDQKIKILKYINPRNLIEQKTLFLNHSEFSPRFFYRECDLDFDAMRNEIRKIPRKVDHFLFPLYRKKLENIENKISLLESIDSSSFSNFSKKTFAGVSAQNYRDATAFLQKNLKKTLLDESKELTAEETSIRINDFLDSRKLGHWKIKFIDDSVADIQITKRNFILIKKNAKFRENRIQAIIAHEIGTHVFRLENGKRQKFRIFERGTSNYLRTEEGLAIYNQNVLNLNLGQKFCLPALHIVSIYMASKMNFCDLFHFLQNTFSIDDDFAWHLCVKAKRGFRDTAKKGAFTKDALYFLGHRDVEKFIAKDGKISELYVGKIAIEDLPIIQKIEGLQKPKFLI